MWLCASSVTLICLTDPYFTKCLPYPHRLEGYSICHICNISNGHPFLLICANVSHSGVVSLINSAGFILVFGDYMSAGNLSRQPATGFLPSYAQSQANKFT